MSGLRYSLSGNSNLLVLCPAERSISNERNAVIHGIEPGMTLPEPWFHPKGRRRRRQTDMTATEVYDDTTWLRCMSAQSPAVGPFFDRSPYTHSHTTYVIFQNLLTHQNHLTTLLRSTQPQQWSSSQSASMPKPFETPVVRPAWPLA